MAITQFTGEYRWLSNFYPVAIACKGHVFPSVEHAYQALKCADPAEYTRFLGIAAGEAKRLGKRVKMRPSFNEERVKVMLWLLRRKFENPELRAKLLATGDTPLVEGNTWGDAFWGVDLRTGRGQNMLGKLIMKVRAELQAQE